MTSPPAADDPVVAAVHGWCAGSGLECWDLRCDVCDGSIPFHPQQIAKHMKAHMSKNRRMQSTKTVHFTVSTSVPAPSDDILTDE